MNRQSLNQDTKVNSYDLRIFLLLLTITAFILLIGLRLFNLQILSNAYYKNIAANQHGGSSTIEAKRGDIYLTSAINGSTLLVATNVTKNTVYAVPKEIEDKKTTANKLATLLEMPAGDILPKISGNGSFSIIKKQVEDPVAATIKKSKIKGVYLEPGDVRFYPENDLASQVIGFLGYKADKRVGQYGVEGEYEKELAGNNGLLDSDLDAAGRLIATASRSFMPARDGDNIFLTVDPAIQFKAQQVLADSVQKHTADGGSVVVINPKTGAVLAMASFPTFDLNNYGKVENPAVYSNKAFADYEPGSIFKAITMAAALNEGKLTPQTTYDNTGSVQVDDKVIKNSDPNEFLGTQNMIQVLNQSLNTGAVFAQQQIGNQKFRDYVRKFGFGSLVDINLPGQVIGNLDNLNKKGNVFFATASFGQGITVTPIQMIQAYSILANGGKTAIPYIVDKIERQDGKEDRPRPASGAQAIEPKTASALSGMLVDVVENGHGKRAAVKGYFIAGKTGTAQVAYKDRAGYDPNQNIGSFIGFGPVDNPEFLMLVRIDNPRDVKFAESTAAPAFGEIAQFILNYLQIAPSR